MIIRRWAPLAPLLVMLFVLVGVSSASPASVSLDLIYLSPGSSAGFTDIVARNLGPSGVGNGAIGFTVYIEYDHTKGTLSSVTTGAAFAALGCGFSTLRTELGGSAAQIDGTCQSSIPTAGVADPGDIVMATLNWTCVAPFLVNVAAGPSGGTALTEVFDPNFNEYFVPENQLTDGGACGEPTAVTLNALNAGSAIPTSNAIYPAIAGAVALLTAAGVAFRGVLRKH